MDIKTYAKATALNLLVLTIGALLGPIAVHSDRLFDSVVHAQSSPKGAATKAEPSATTAPLDPNFEYISPTVAGGSAAFETLLAHRVASDILMVNGYDLLKIQNSTLSAMVARGVITQEQAVQIANSAKVEKPLRLQPHP